MLHLVSRTDAASKRDAVRPVSRSLGGLALPDPDELAASRWPYVLSEAFSAASDRARGSGTCTALLISVTDVEIQRNPAKSRNMSATRPGTFAHCCVMTVSAAGVHLYQGYGPRGYTLLQHMQNKADSYPLSFAEGEAWVKRFEDFAAESGGAWTAEVNAAYRDCFDVDLVILGTMKIGSQLDCYVQVHGPIEFDASLVRRNLALLPSKGTGPKIPCTDGSDAKSREPLSLRYRPDGGAKQYYIPLVRRCACCGNRSNTEACARCKVAYYCSKQCQKKDWKVCHKKVCTSLK